MYITNPKTKEKVTVSEFFRQWKQGMKNISPYQQALTTQFGQIISGIGVLWGIVFSLYIGYWWMGVILIGGMIVLAVQYLGNWQRKVILKEHEELLNQAIPMKIEEVINGNTQLVG